MGRYGIVDFRPDTVVSKVLTEFVATLAEHGEDVVDGIYHGNLTRCLSPCEVGERYSHEVVAYFSFVTSSNLTAALVVGVQVGQFG